MIVTIHQPNFIPWYPFFQKMEQADLFILLGHCQFEKNGFQNRFQLENTWNTLSVKKGKEPIVEKEYINPSIITNNALFIITLKLRLKYITIMVKTIKRIK